MKKILGIIALIAFVFNVYTVSGNAQIKYIETETSENQDTTEINEEGEHHDDQIAAEYIIIQISADGYVNAHGDHYHYYNGKVPFDGVFSDKLLAPAEYKFDETSIVSEIDNGYVVVFDDKYYVYFEDMTQVKSLRTKDEMLLQSYGIKPNFAKDIAQLKDTFNLGTETIISVDLDAKVEEATQNSIVLYVFEDGFVVLKDKNLHVILKELEGEFVIEKRALTEEASKDKLLKEFDFGSLVSTDLGNKIILKNDKQITITEIK